MMDHQEDILSVKNLTVRYGAIEALTDVSLSVGSGELVTVLGANGAGKTTLLRAVSGIVRSIEGSHINFAGKDVRRDSIDSIARSGLGHVPEGRQIFGGLTVDENLRSGVVGMPDSKDTAARLDWVYEMFPDLADRRRQEGWSLSGGQQQMLAVGRALVGRPKLLMLDEPSLGLAPILVREVLGAVRRICDGGTSILLVEQNASAALEIADRGYVLRSGKVLLTDSASALSRDETIANAYLGRGTL